MMAVGIARVKHLGAPHVKRITPNLKTKNDLCNELCKYINAFLLLNLHI